MQYGIDDYFCKSAVAVDKEDSLKDASVQPDQRRNNRHHVPNEAAVRAPRAFTICNEKSAIPDAGIPVEFQQPFVLAF